MKLKIKNKKFKAKIQIEPKIYLGELDKGSWMNKFYQINDALELNLKKILVIGVGNGVVENYLKNQGIYVHTFDIIPPPDAITQVLLLPRRLRSKSFGSPQHVFH